MPLILVTPPETEPLSIADVRDRANISVTDLSDVSVTALITTVRQKIERRYGIAMINQGWKLVLDRFAGMGCYPYPIETGFGSPGYSNSGWRPSYGNGLSSFEIPINLTPVSSVTAISYADTNGDTQVVDPTTYNLLSADLRSSVALLNGASWPSTAYIAGAVQVSFEAGYGVDGTTTPELLKAAMILHIARLRPLMTRDITISLDSVTGVGEKRYIVGSGSTDVVDAAIDNLLQDFVRPSL